MPGDPVFLAFDLDPGSCRAMTGTVLDDRLVIREVARSPVKPMRVRSNVHWDVYTILAWVREALGSIESEGLRPDGLAFDSWGFDFALLGRDGRFLVRPYCHLDPWTSGLAERFAERIPRDRVFELTGALPTPHSTLIQLFGLALGQPAILSKASTLLFMSDLFSHLLGGRGASEVTIASTSVLLDPRTGTWVEELLGAVGLDPGAMQEVVEPGTSLGEVSPGDNALGGVPVRACAGHSTAGAAASIPFSDDDRCFIICGSSCSMGVELDEPLITSGVLEAGLSNQRGVDGAGLLLRDFGGLRLLSQSLDSRPAGSPAQWDAVERAARSAPSFGPLIDPLDPLFAYPGDVVRAVAEYCSDTGQAAPADEGSLVRCILESLALVFAETLQTLRDVTGRALGRVHLAGEGCGSDLLCRLTADACGATVVPGPAYASATGNLLTQAVAAGAVGDMEAGRSLAASSFEPSLYEPSGDVGWPEAAGRLRDARSRRTGSRGLGL